MIGMKITKEITREHMDTYLTIMVTVLVATQVIRIAQNTIQQRDRSLGRCDARRF